MRYMSVCARKNFQDYNEKAWLSPPPPPPLHRTLFSPRNKFSGLNIGRFRIMFDAVMRSGLRSFVCNTWRWYLLGMSVSCQYTQWEMTEPLFCTKRSGHVCIMSVELVSTVDRVVHSLSLPLSFPPAPFNIVSSRSPSLGGRTTANSHSSTDKTNVVSGGGWCTWPLRGHYATYPSRMHCVCISFVVKSLSHVKWTVKAIPVIIRVGRAVADLDGHRSNTSHSFISWPILYSVLLLQLDFINQ